MILSYAIAAQTRKPSPDISTLSSDLYFLFLCMFSSLLCPLVLALQYNPHSKVLGFDTDRFLSLLVDWLSAFCPHCVRDFFSCCTVKRHRER